MKALVAGLALLGAISSLSLPLASAYEEMSVSGGGSVRGKVTFKGTPPEPKLFEFVKFPQPDFCSKADSDGKGHRILREVKVKDGALGDVVVFIEGIEKGKPFKFTGTDVTADLCRFLVQGGPSAMVGVVMNRNEIRVKNLDADPSDPKSADGVLHNPHGYEVKGGASSTIFNKPLPTKGMVLTQKLIFRKHDSFMLMQCDQHNFMNVWFHPVDNPYYAIVGEDGTFSIGDIPPGSYEIYAFHPTLGTEEQKLTVVAGGKETVNFEFKK
ncbi:MAG: carboxypeptidase regulatory-like domain-containing protein [Nitrospirae bacterium]|nr:carboxypeptidase regulatory-like domain-containing protein [Nitrospirota bacterium]